MSDQDNVALARRFFEDFATGRQTQLAEALMTPDYVYHDPQIPNVRGPQAYAQVLAVYQEGVDGRWNLEQVLPAGPEHVVVRWTGTGVHNAAVMGIPPTGKAVRVAAISVLRVAGGKVAEHWCVWDTLGMLQQMGVVPPPGQAA